MILIVPVKRHVKQFFQSSHVLGAESIDVRRNSRIGETVAAVFCAYPLQDGDMGELAPTDLLDPDKLHFNLLFPLNSSLVNDARLIQLGKMLEVIFEFYAIGFCRGRQDIFNSLNGAAERFVDKHQISVDDYSADAVRKLVDRATRKNDNLFNRLSLKEKREVSNLSA